MNSFANWPVARIAQKIRPETIVFTPLVPYFGKSILEVFLEKYNKEHSKGF